MSSTTYVAKTINGTEVTRTTKTMAYTHAVVGQDGYFSWHTSKALAEKAAAKYDGTKVVPAVPQVKEAPAKKAPAKKAPAKVEENGSEQDPKTMEGYRVHTKSRSSKTTAVLLDGEAAGMDTEAGRWQLVCLDHSFIMSHTSQRFSRDVLAHPEEWCEPCGKAFRKAQKAGA